MIIFSAQIWEVGSIWYRKLVVLTLCRLIMNRGADFYVSIIIYIQYPFPHKGTYEYTLYEPK